MKQSMRNRSGRLLLGKAAKNRRVAGASSSESLLGNDNNNNNNNDDDEDGTTNRKQFDQGPLVDPVALVAAAATSSTSTATASNEVQFVPAFGKSEKHQTKQKQSHVRRTQKSQTVTSETSNGDPPSFEVSWDGIMEESQTSDSYFHQPNIAVQKSFSRSLDYSVSSSSDTRADAMSAAEPNPPKFNTPTTPSTTPSTASNISHLLPPTYASHTAKSNNLTEIPPPSDTASNVSSSTGMRRGPRMAKLASLFKQKNATKQIKAKNPTAHVPASPSGTSQVSSGSSGYVGWPGTQDKRGKTVALETSSYEDSSVGAAGFSQKSYQKELDSINGGVGSEARNQYERQLADLEMHKWVTQDDGDATSSVVSGARQAQARISNGDNVSTKYHLVDTTKRAASNAGTAVSGALSIHNLFDTSSERQSQVPPLDPWDIDSASQPPSSPAASSISKDSSAFFNSATAPGFPALRRNVEGAASVMRPKLSKENLEKNDHYSPPSRVYSAHVATRGYEGFLNKTRDVPNLMDEVDSDSLASSANNSKRGISAMNGKKLLGLPEQQPRPRQQREVDGESDIFDGIVGAAKRQPTTTIPKYHHGNSLSNHHHHHYHNSHRNDQKLRPTASPEPINRSQTSDDSVSVVMIGGGLAAIQTTQEAYDNRQTPSDFDDRLSNSDVDQYGYAQTPGFSKMLTAGRSLRDTANPKGLWQTPSDDDTSKEMFDMLSELQSLSNYGDLSKYSVHAEQSKLIVSAFRNFSKHQTAQSEDGWNELEDTKKAFALSEMRSRIMEKDLERGLERQGGTVVVDDVALTPYYQTGSRIRDAVIVSKAWRDGASPKDVMTASNLTRRAAWTFFVKRPLQHRGYHAPIRPHYAYSNSDPNHDTASVASDHSYVGVTRVYGLEEITWMDDSDLMQLRCSSLGPRHMRGAEMFTIGDCQSILLKLTNERCLQIRQELNDATARQIDAEEMMKADGDTGDGIMTESEMIYLASMEEVKTISRMLVVAERSFNLVRDRIEKLVARYEAMLVRIENESIATASVITYEESSYYSEDDLSEGGYSSEEEREREMFQRRAQRAELRAELAAREAILSRHHTHKVEDEKRREIEVLQQQLADLQSESSLAISEREHSHVLAKVIATHRNGFDGASSHGAASSISVMSREKINSVKQKFRDRMADRMKRRSTGGGGGGGGGSESGSSVVMRAYAPRYNPRPQYIVDRPPLTVRSQRRQLVGEEMYQHLDFYERSLKAVDSTRR